MNTVHHLLYSPSQKLLVEDFAIQYLIDNLLVGPTPTTLKKHLSFIYEADEEPKADSVQEETLESKDTKILEAAVHQSTGYI